MLKKKFRKQNAKTPLKEAYFVSMSDNQLNDDFILHSHFMEICNCDLYSEIISKPSSLDSLR